MKSYWPIGNQILIAKWLISKGLWCTKKCIHWFTDSSFIWATSPHVMDPDFVIPSLATLTLALKLGAVFGDLFKHIAIAMFTIRVFPTPAYLLSKPFGPFGDFWKCCWACFSLKTPGLHFGHVETDFWKQKNRHPCSLPDGALSVDVTTPSPCFLRPWPHFTPVWPCCRFQ